MKKSFGEICCSFFVGFILLTGLMFTCILLVKGLEINFFLWVFYPCAVYFVSFILCLIFQ